MHSLLAGRMLLELHQWGQQTVRGDEFKDFGSSFAEQVNASEFEALVPADNAIAPTDDVDAMQMTQTSDP